MANCPFELSSSLNSSASISVLSEMKESLMYCEKTTTKAQIQPIVLKKDKISRTSIKIKRWFFVSLIIGIPLSLIILLRHLLCSNHFIDLSFKPNYISSLTDANDYQIIELSNKIQMALVSNRQSDISLFSITIDYGTSNDPDDYKGLSHLILKAKLNMMIGEYVRKNNNGIKHFNLTYRIDEEMSQITFEIDKEYFWASLIYLIESLTRKDEISDSLLDDSLEGINRKFEGFKNSDSFRLLHVINTIIYRKENFIGNYETLKKNETVLSLLKNQIDYAFKQYYIGNNMKIVIESEDSMKVLKEKVPKLFKDIPYISKEVTTIGTNENKNTYFKTNNMNKLNRLNLGKAIWIQSHLYLRNLKLVFIIPNPTNEAYIYYQYLNHLLNQQGNNTLFQKGVDLNVIFGFNSTISRVLSTHIQLELNYCLVKSGLFNLEVIITQTYSHLVALTSMTFSKERFNEFVEIQRDLILFQEETMQQRKNRLLLYLLQKKTFDDYYAFTESAFINYQNDNYLTPENSLIILESDEVDFFKYKIFTKNYLANKIQDPHFDFTYYIMDLSKETMDSIRNSPNANANFLWEPNKFITKKKEKIDFDDKINSIERTEMEPKKIIETNHTIIWHRVIIIIYITVSLTDHLDYQKL